MAESYQKPQSMPKTGVILSQPISSDPIYPPQNLRPLPSPAPRLPAASTIGIPYYARRPAPSRLGFRQHDIIRMAATTTSRKGGWGLVFSALCFSFFSDTRQLCVVPRQDVREPHEGFLGHWMLSPGYSSALGSVPEAPSIYDEYGRAGAWSVSLGGAGGVGRRLGADDDRLPRCKP